MDSRQKMGVVLLLLLNFIDLAVSTSYDNYLARLAEKNRLLMDNFVQRNPRGQYVMDLLGSTDYTAGHPVLDDTIEENRIDDQQWRSFVKELEFARQLASKEGNETDVQSEWPQTRWSSPEILPPENGGDARFSDSSTPTRRTEVTQQNMLWGEHKVSGGSGEIGQWLDYAVLGAGLQDEDDDQVAPASPDSAAPEFKENNLPAYCDPPNPCPIGYDPEQLDSPCDRNFVYTAEANRDWIMNKLARGECTCDTEHMSSCPLPKDGSPFAGRGGSKPPVVNPYTQGRKRKRLVAKKAYHYTNPAKRYYYMNGKVLKKVVKKNGVFSSENILI